MSDDELTLSSYALEALAQFKLEEQQRLDTFNRLNQQAEADFQKEHQRKEISIDFFQEDWQLSQFWYTDETSDILAKALFEGATKDTVIVIASAPAVYAAMTRINDWPTEHVYLLEFDNRFKVLAGKKFFQYDYNTPDDVPEELRHKCDRLLIDPPFLEEECQTKSAQAARNLLVKGDHKLISSTGERMRDIMKKTYPECQMTDFYPQHKNGLSNEFRCYASFTCSYWNFGED